MRALLAGGVFAALVAGTGSVAWAVDCVDADGDGFQAPNVPMGCTLGTAPDCDDGNPFTHPGAPELCDNADNDCNGVVDDGPGGGTLGCLVGAGPGCPSPMPASPDPFDPMGPEPALIQDCCQLKGNCTAGGVCDVDPLHVGTLPPTYTPEGPQNTATCFDGIDNDCDGLKDHADDHPTPGGGPTDICKLPTDSICNGFDDDNNGVIDDLFNVGAPCSVGNGGCTTTGVFKCKADGTGTECSAVPATPKPEDLAHPGSCTDFKDNDCDGLTDVFDPGCQKPEFCNGLDDDGDGVVDNGFPGLGTPCSVGVGACETTGTIVCGLDKMSTRCDATAGNPSPEGPSGATCSDGIDNDCDGFTDATDPGCGGAGLTVECSLGTLDCRGLHTVQFQSSSNTATVTAELLALSAEGDTLGSVPNVHNGDKALLFSTKRKVKISSNGTFHRITAPLPVLHVHAEEGDVTADAYCSPIPFVKAFDPGCCGFTSKSAGDTTPVTVAIPGIDPHSLTFVIDGVDVFAALGINPATDFPGGPFSGSVNIGGTLVQVTDLFVRTAPPASLTPNTLTMNLVGLPCGGHLIVTNGQPAALPLHQSQNCFEDDYKDKCVAAVLGVQIDDPLPQQTDLPSPTHVSGSVCHGRQISNIRLNGLEQPTQPQIMIKGDGKVTADTYKVNFDTNLPATDLRRAVFTGETPLGSLDRGSNRIVADVVDEFGNRAFTDVVAAVGPVAKPNVGPVQLQTQRVARDTLQQAIQMTQTEIPDAFVLGLTESAIDNIIDSKCKEKGVDFLTKVRNTLLNPECKPKADPTLKGAPCGTPDGLNRCTAAGGVCSDLVCHAEGSPLNGTPCPDEAGQRACTAEGGVCARLCGPTPGSLLDNGPCGNFDQINDCQNAGGSCPASIQTIETPFCTCNIPAVIRPTDVVQIDPNARVSCDATLLDHRLRFTMTVPDLRVSIGVHGSCDGFLCANASINYDGSTDLTGMNVVIDLTEGRLEGTPTDPGLCGNGTVDVAAGEFCDPTAPDGSTGCAGDFPGGGQHCNVSTGTSCSKDSDCPSGEQCRPDAECSETCVACTQPPHASEPQPPIDDNFVDLGCGCTLVTILTFGLVIVAFIFGGPILGFGALGLAALIFALAFQFDVETIAPPTEINTDPVGIAEPMIDDKVEEFGVQMKAKVDKVTINPQGLTTSLKGIFSILDPDNENPEVPGAVLTPAPVPMPPLQVSNPGNSFFVLADDTFNQLFAALSAGPMFKTGFEQTTTKVCSVSLTRCAADADCPSGETCSEQPMTVLTFIPDLNSRPLLKTLLASKGIVGSTRIIVHGRPEMPPQFVIDDDPKRCGGVATGGRCEMDSDCNRCSTTNTQACLVAGDCPSGETCTIAAANTCLTVAPPTTPVETDLRLNDFFLELLADRNANGVDGAFGSAQNCFKAGSPITGDCSVMRICLDVSFLTNQQLGMCLNPDTGQMQPQIQTLVEAVKEGRTLAPKGEVCAQVAADTPNDQTTQAGLDTKTIDVFQMNAQQNTPPLCAQGLDLAGLGTFSNPRLVAVDVPGGDPEGFDDYLGITGDVVPGP